MALIFRYSTMSSGKSTSLLQVAFNYDEVGLTPILIKPKFDTRDEGVIKSRIGIMRGVDHLIDNNDNIFNLISGYNNGDKDCDCVLVDEANFLTKEQARQLWQIDTQLNIPVIAYGLRVDYRGEGFEGSKELLTLAHKIEELKTVDETGKKCTMHLRKVNGSYVFEGNPTIVGDIVGEEKYESCTSIKWLNEYNKYKKNIIASQIDHRGGMC